MDEQPRVSVVIGREGEGLAFLVVALPRHLAKLPDRAGPVEAFWRGQRK